MRPTTLISLAALLVACSDPSGASTSEVPGGTPEPSPTSAPLTDEPTEPTLAHACFADALDVEVGRGGQGELPTESGAPHTLVHGQQGGWHIDLSGYVYGVTDLVKVAATVRVVDDDWIIGGLEQEPLRTALVAWSESECSGSFYGLRLYIDDNGPHNLDTICALEGAAVEVEVTVTDLLDPTGERTKTVIDEGVLSLDPADVEPCGS